MRVTIRVATGNSAQQARQVQQQLQGITTAARQANAAGAAGGHMAGIWGNPAGLAGNLEKLGKNLQWTGRQLEYRFTLPLLAAGVMATKWALANEKAVTRVRKVYGDIDMPMEQVNSEVDQLAKGFRVLSDIMGVNQDEVAMVGAAWAAAGAQGVQLLKLTRLTAETSLLGDMGLEDAGKSLLSIQSQYQLSTEGLTHAVALLNAVENQTKIQLPELITFFTRSAGTARTAGMSILELAQAAAALVPAAGSAASAGNGLKTIISRLMSPTADMVELFGQMGLSTAKWNAEGATAWTRLNELAVKFNEADAGQQAYASSILGSRFQVSKISQLFRDLVDPVGESAKAMRAAGDDAKNMALYQRELNTLMASDPQVMKILWTQLKNLASEAIIPLIPAIKSVLQSIIGVVRWFTSLSPAVQKTAMMGLLFLAVLGPLIAYMGAFIVLGAQFFKMWRGIFLLFTLFTNSWNVRVIMFGIGYAMNWVVGRVFWAMTSIVQATLWGNLKMHVITAAAWVKRMAMEAAGWAFWTAIRIAGWVKTVAVEAAGWLATQAVAAAGSIATFIAAGGWIPLLIIAVAAGMFMFRKKIGDAISWVVRAFGLLPQGIAAAFRMVIQVIGRAIGKVRELLSWLNPFARHSPSLVENVIAGVDIIAKKYASLSGLSSIFRQAAADFVFFGQATAGMSSSFEAGDTAKKRADIVAFDPAAGPAVDLMMDSVHALEAILIPLGAEFARQERIVQEWSAQLDLANEHVDSLTETLETLQDRASELNDELDSAKGILNDLKNTPISGMRAYSDAIFDNEMAQKRLRLELLRLGDAGQTIDDLKSRMSTLQGEIEMMRGKQTELRRAGAGSDILAPYDAQIALLESEQKKIAAQIVSGNKLQNDLAALQKQGEILDLEQSLKFDPLKRQIDDVSNAMTEMPFDELLSRVKEQSEIVADLTVQWEAAEAAVQHQQAAVDAATKSRDAIQRSYDIEKKKLDELGAAYDAVEDAIQKMRSAFDGLASDAAATMAALKEAEAAVDGFAEAASDFEIPEDAFAIDPELGLGSIEDLVAEWQKEIDKQFAKIDFFKPLKDAWREVTSWFGFNHPLLALAINPVVGLVGLIWSQVIMGMWRFTEDFRNQLGKVKDNIGEFVGIARHEIAEKFTNIWNTFTANLAEMYHTWIEPILFKLGQVFMGLWQNYVQPAGAGIVSTVDWIRDRVMSAFGWVRDRVGGIWEGIGNSIRAGVNIGISAINTLIRGINAVASHLPGNFHINEIPYVGSSSAGTGHTPEGALHGYAHGGQVPGHGTGDTVPAYLTPQEYVMPVGAVKKYGVRFMDDVRAGRFAQGGLVGTIKSALGKAMSVGKTVLGGARKIATTAAFAPFNIAADLAIDRIPWDLIRQAVRAVKDQVYNWVKGGAVGLARGGIARHGSGGMLANIAEGSHDEAVVPLPHGFDPKDMGKRELHFHGDLSFPNIKSGDDAEEFLRNLESLAA